jgi:hypothetical protein
MGGSTQQYWLHAVGKEKQTIGARINLTFRTVHAKPGRSS